MEIKYRVANKFSYLADDSYLFAFVDDAICDTEQDAEELIRAWHSRNPDKQAEFTIIKVYQFTPTP